MKRLVFGTVLLAVGLSAPAIGDDLIDGSHVDEIAGIATGYGTAQLLTDDDGAPRISGAIKGVPYQIFFMNCTEGKDCEDLNFYAGFSDIKPTLEAINSWNRDKRFGRAYLDSDLDAVIELDVNLQYGVSRDNLDAAFGVWSLLLGQFTDYVGYKTK